jgi:chemotaxis signal transduction protein
MVSLKPSRNVNQDTLQVLVVPCQNLWLALQIEKVQKVIRIPEIYQGGEKTLGLAHFGDREAIIIDLHQKIYHIPNPGIERYLIVLQAHDHLFGIPAILLPTLIRIPKTELKPLPAEYRDRDTLGIASHLISIERGEQTQTLFVLDPDRLFVQGVLF